MSMIGGIWLGRLLAFSRGSYPLPPPAPTKFISAAHDPEVFPVQEEPMHASTELRQQTLFQMEPRVPGKRGPDKLPRVTGLSEFLGTIEPGRTEFMIFDSEEQAKKCRGSLQSMARKSWGPHYKADCQQAGIRVYVTRKEKQ